MKTFSEFTQHLTEDVENQGTPKDFKCGHSGTVPSNMGRGEARKKRISDYFGRNCPDCAEKKLNGLHQELLDSSLKRHPEEKHAELKSFHQKAHEERVKKMKNNYWK